MTDTKFLLATLLKLFLFHNNSPQTSEDMNVLFYNFF